MGIFIGIALGIASFHWMVEFFHLSQSLAEPTGWAIGILAWVIADNFSKVAKLFSNQTNSKQMVKLQKRLDVLEQENQELKVFKQKHDQHLQHEREMDFFKK